MTGRVDDGIRLERKKTEFLSKRADYIIDTTHLLTRELKKELNNIFVDNGKFSNMMISVSVLSDSSTEYRKMQIWYLMCAFCRIRIM